MMQLSATALVTGLWTLSPTASAASHLHSAQRVLQSSVAAAPTFANCEFTAHGSAVRCEETTGGAAIVYTLPCPQTARTVSDCLIDQRRLCYQINDTPCVASTYCGDTESFQLDCSNVEGGVDGSDTCAVTDCDGTCLDDDTTSLIDYNAPDTALDNACGRLGVSTEFKCSGETCNVNLEWTHLLADATEIRIVASRPSDSTVLESCMVSVGPGDVCPCETAGCPENSNTVSYDCGAFSDDWCAKSECGVCVRTGTAPSGGTDGGSTTTTTTASPVATSTTSEPSSAPSVVLVEDQETMSPSSSPSVGSTAEPTDSPSVGASATPTVTASTTPSLNPTTTAPTTAGPTQAPVTTPITTMPSGAPVVAPVSASPTTTAPVSASPTTAAPVDATPVETPISVNNGFTTQAPVATTDTSTGTPDTSTGSPITFVDNTLTPAPSAAPVGTTITSTTTTGTPVAAVSDPSSTTTSSEVPSDVPSMFPLPSECSLNPQCASLGLTGTCCPTIDDWTLECCGTTPPVERTCSGNDRCAALELTGSCCPTNDERYLDCCTTIPDQCQQDGVCEFFSAVEYKAELERSGAAAFRTLRLGVASGIVLALTTTMLW